MSVGRYAMRGRAFQPRAFMPRALANSGEAPVVAAPCDGWTAQTRVRHSVSESRERVMICQTRNRVWIARDR